MTSFLPNTADAMKARHGEISDTRIRKAYQTVPHSFSETGRLEFGNTLVFRHSQTNSVLANDIWTETSEGEYFVFAEPEDEDEPHVMDSGTLAKSSFVLVKAGDKPSMHGNERFDRATQNNLHYGQPFQIMCNPSLLVCEKTNMIGAPLFLKAGKSMYGQHHVLSLTKNASDSRTHFVACPVSCATTSDPFAKDLIRAKGKLVENTDEICIKNLMSNLPLCLDGERNGGCGNPVFSRTFKVVCGGISEVSTARNTSKEVSRKFSWKLETSSRPEAGVDRRNLPKRITNPKELMKKIKQVLVERQNHEYGIREISREFRLIDTSGDGKLDKEEVSSGLEKFGVSLDAEQLDLVAKYLDTDGDGTIDLNEFLVALRGPLSKRRLKLILRAYENLDTDGNGTVTLDEISAIYDTSCHPDVIDGKKTHEEVIKEFMLQWDNGGGADDDGDNRKGDGIITKQEFIHYYRDVSASIDDDDYFELMMRNAWHISGGTGWCQNTSNIRCLVAHNDGSTEIVELIDDFGISRNDMPAIRAKLRKQGVTDIKKVSLSD